MSVPDFKANCLTQVKGVLNTVTGHVASTLSLGTSSSDFRQRSSRRLRRGDKATIELLKPELRLGGSYVPGSDELMYGLTAKQRAFAGPVGLKAKAAVQYPMRSQQVLLILQQWCWLFRKADRTESSFLSVSWTVKSPMLKRVSAQPMHTTSSLGRLNVLLPVA